MARAAVWRSNDSNSAWGLSGFNRNAIEVSPGNISRSNSSRFVLNVLKTYRLVSPGGRLCRPHSKGREAGGSAGASAGEVRADDQSRDRQGTWPRSAGHVAHRRRRGDRVANPIGRYWAIRYAG